MKFALVAFALTFAFVGCTSAGADQELAGTAWELVSVGSFSSMPSGVATPTIHFGPDGRLNGNTGCNSASGSYKTSGDTLSIGPLITTKRACAEDAGNELERAYVRALESARWFRISERELELVGENGSPLARFRATRA